MNSLARLAEREPLEPETDGRGVWGNIDWQRLWLNVEQQRWRTLALVPAGANVPLDLTLDAAVALARTGMARHGRQIHVADATRVGFGDLADFIDQLRDTLSGGPTILALAPASYSPVTVQLAQSADLSLLCVVLRSMRVSEARQTVDEIGRQHFFGAITFQ
jgi:hypothetical protein